jgi:hypothetical protein
MGTDGFSRYPVQDRALLTRLVDALVDHYGQGSLNRAAGAIGITQPTLYRLHAGEAERVSQATMHSLEVALEPMDRQLRRDLPRAIMQAAGLRLYLRGYFTWCRERALRLTNRRGRPWVPRKGQAPRQESARWRKLPTSMDLSDTLKVAQEECSDIFERLNRFVSRKGIPPERHRVAEVRMVEPLAEWSASGCFERRWRTLTPKQRRQFLLAGLRREEILMSGKHPQVVATELAAGQYPDDD